ncbi:hypothetical protein EBU71_18170 [bacterium]|jgi:hypothetical protein|nr:hypothetical protein [Candidatus Elulimicrobium humile]
MYVDGYMLLVIYVFACGAFLIALWMFLTLEDMKENGKKWIKMNKELLDKVDRLEKGSGPTSFFKK